MVDDPMRVERIFLENINAPFIHFDSLEYPWEGILYEMKVLR